MNNIIEDSSAVQGMIGPFELRNTLGKGMSGKVKLGVDTRTNEAVAVKIMFRDKMTARSLQQLQREITSMKALQHPNVLKMREVVPRASYVKKNGTVREAVVLVLDVAAGGELFDFMMITGAFPEPVARTYFLQLLSALELCHRHGIAHRDIKPENILLDERFTLKLADFGLSSILEDANGVCCTECGTRSYMAPEVLARQPYDGSKADLWSAGVVLFIMLAGNPPFQMANSADWWFKAVSSSRHDRFWAAHLRGCPTFPEGAQQLLNKIFVAEPAQRATLEQVKAHPWLAGETWPTERVQRELANRKHQIAAQKDAERQAHLRKKAAEAARAGRGLVDPFKRPVNRSVAAAPSPAGAGSSVDAAAECLAGTSLSSSLLTIEAPPLPEGFDVLQAFYSAERAGPLLDRLAAALAACVDGDGGDAPVVDQRPASASVKAVFPKRGLEVMARVYASPAQGCHIVSLSRRAGDAFAFYDVRKRVAAALSDGPSAVASSARDLEGANSTVDAFDLEAEEPEAAAAAVAAAAAASNGIYGDGVEKREKAMEPGAEEETLAENDVDCI